MGTIKLSAALADLDSKLTPSGKPITFSIKFIKKDGELVFIRKSIKVGLARMNLLENAFRGVVAVDDQNDWIGHPTPVKIWNIIEYNGFKVTY
jgi:hypothetical protein